MAPTAYVQPIVDSTSAFKPDIFKGKVLFCTGGGSGICRAMTEAIVGLHFTVTVRPTRTDSRCRCAMVRARLLLGGRAWSLLLSACLWRLTTFLTRLERLQQTAKELEELTGQACLPAQADVRQPAALKDAVARTIEKFGRIDFVICGRCS